MATMPGLGSDVFWGDPDKPPPDWREHPLPDAHEDDDSYSEDATPERKAWVRAVAGFDPYEVDEEDDEDDEPVAESAPLHETAADTGANRLAQRAAEIWREQYP